MPFAQIPTSGIGSQVSQGTASGAAGAGIASGLASTVAQAVPNNSIGRGGQIAAQSLFTAAAAANVVPVFGQFASAGLAIAGLLTKIFAGKKKKKQERAATAKRVKTEAASRAVQQGAQSDTRGSIGQSSGQGPQQIAAPVGMPGVPGFSGYGGNQSPSVQPTQQVLHSSIGMK